LLVLTNVYDIASLILFGTISFRSINVVATIEFMLSYVDMFNLGNDDNVTELGMYFIFWNVLRLINFVVILVHVLSVYEYEYSCVLLVSIVNN
jgi:hypothetical protein